MTARLCLLISISCVHMSCTTTTAGPGGVPEPVTRAPASEVLTLNGIRVNRTERWIEFDGFVPIDAGNPSGLFGSMELFVCSGDAKSHESLVQTDARPSHVHAALLLLGAAPGSPATFDRRAGTLQRSPATGTPLRVEFRLDDGRSDSPAAWIVESTRGERLPPHNFVFAGSREAEGRGYLADNDGILISLVTFPTVDDFDRPTPGVGIGIETIVWPVAWSESQDTDPMLWEPDPERIPPLGTELVVRISPAD